MDVVKTIAKVGAQSGTYSGLVYVVVVVGVILKIYSKYPLVNTQLLIVLAKAAEAGDPRPTLGLLFPPGLGFNSQALDCWVRRPEILLPAIDPVVDPAAPANRINLQTRPIATGGNGTKPALALAAGLVSLALAMSGWFTKHSLTRVCLSSIKRKIESFIQKVDSLPARRLSLLKNYMDMSMQM
ncbi:hypothetical protein FRX31_015505 [Thalictrum thalictroides]|uniref:Transmembrane protein n=1 Tax=Thalictrum thalictroides TaxID=46969 RepID=A0A7J6WDF9_THATH|nr:hypothetical protein FRX31_015505 [Thalictrum thalictroides]